MTRDTRRWLIATVALGMLLWGGEGAMAQLAADKTAEIGQTLTLRDMVSKGGMLIYVLGFTSVLGLALVVYFFVILRRVQVVPSTLRDEVLDRIEAGQLNDARTACGYKPCAFSEIAIAAIDCVNSLEKNDPFLLKDVIEGEGSRQAMALQSQIQYLLDIGVVAPMIGLLGTVFGMVHAFGVVALDLAKAKPMILAAGVAEALVNTAGGLIVGIPAMIFYAYFRGRSSKLVAELEQASMSVFMALVQKKRGQ
jgi:biopolymer transport protein ExbB